MADLRASDGYPPLSHGICSICRAPVLDVIPKESTVELAPPDEIDILNYEIIQVNIVLGVQELLQAYDQWLQLEGMAPLSFFIWMALTEKYPNYDNPEALILAAQHFSELPIEQFDQLNNNNNNDGI